ncbi:pAS domain S-box [Clostridium sp. CAG:628]|nr:pAS domain S-box [Clostridium sp. CAG:628]
MPNLYLPVTAFLLSFVLLVIYFSKKRVHLLENSIYILMIFSILMDSALVSLLFYNYYTNYNVSLVSLLNKLDYVFLIIWSSSLMLYIFVITYKERKRFKRLLKKVSTSVIVLDIIMFVVVFNSKIDLIIKDSIHQTAQGEAVILSIIFCLFYILVSLLIVLFNLKKINIKHLPVFVIIFTAILIAILFSVNPYLIIISIGLTIDNFIMYFTIENPDIKLINELELAKDNLENANLVKSEFLRSMSHEIRTPMNQIIGCASVIEMEDNLSEESKDVLNGLVNSTNSLLDVCNGIINVSQIESGNVDILISGYNPKEVIEDIINLNKKRLTNKDVEIVSNYSELPDVVYGDKDKVKQIVSNLLSNAIKYTDKGKIEVSVSSSVKKDKCDIEIVVKDTGKGISEENIDLIFNKFGKLEKNSDTLGLGLGLFITKNLVNILGGNISITSELGKGSEFKVFLHESLVDTSTKLDLSSVNIMIIHSSNMIRAFLKNSIMKYEIKVNDFSNGVEAIKELKRVDYDVVIIDKYISDVKLEELVRTIKEDISSNIKIMAIGNDENIDYVDMFVSEELDINDIINNIKKALS